MSEPAASTGSDFIRSMIARDLTTGKYDGRVVTRFPPEPNGFLHIGHAKSICLNFDLAAEHPGGRCHLRFDDTNPATEEALYVEGIKRDIRWLGYDWGPHLYHASDYFQKLYDYGIELIDKGLAYIDSSTEHEIQELRGSVTEPGRNSPYRDRTIQENLDLFARMRAGEFADGAHVLRARIDMAHPNMVMRDPVLMRIRHAHHYRQGDAWCLYPLYDFAHCLSDSIERVTHSLCTLEFENNREIYDWLLVNTSAPEPRPEQTEFARLELEYTLTSKRKLKALVDEGHVHGWDDPRMPTLAGLRRRGVTPEAIRTFCGRVGVTRAESTIDLAKLDFVIRDDLNHRAPRAFAVLDPLKVVLTNYPEESTESFEAPLFPPDVGKPGVRELPFGREIYIEADDFSDDPPPGFRRLVSGGEVRLKHAYVIRLDEVVRDTGTGEIRELRCTYDPLSQGGTPADGRAVPGTIHWVSAGHAVPATVRVYEPLFRDPDPGRFEDFREALNPTSEVVKTGAMVEPAAAEAPAGAHFQFERLGYFCADSEDSVPGSPVFNRTVALRDSRPDSLDHARRAAAGAGTGTESRRREGAAAPAGPGAAANPRSPREVLRDSMHLDRFDRLVEHGVPEGLAGNLAKEDAPYALYEDARRSFPEGSPALAKWIVQEIGRAQGESNTEALPDPGALAALVRKVEAGEHSHHQGRRILEALTRGAEDLAEAEARVAGPGEPPEVADLLRDLMARFPDKVTAFRGGKDGLLGFFVGQVMKETAGRADPAAVSEQARSLLTAQDS